MKTGLLVLGLGLLLLGSEARAGDAIKRFKAAWRQAGEDPEKRIAALQIFAEEDDGDSLDALLKYGFAAELNYRIQDAAFEVMAGLKGEAARAWLRKNFKRRRRASERVILARVAAGYPAADAVEVLSAGLGDKDPSVKKASARLLGRVKSAAAVEALIAAYRRASGGRLAAACRDSLRRLTGQKDLGAAEDWAGWWAKNKGAFDPNTASSNEPEVVVRRGITTVSRDGSGLYETIDSEAVVFVVDISNSMRISVDDKDPKALSRLDFVRQELANAIEKQLGAKALFNIVVFSSRVQVWKRKMVRASSANKTAALRFLKKLQPTDRTNIFGALSAAFQIKGADTIYFLTDGTPTEGDLLVPVQIRGAVRSWNRGRDVTVHTIAFLTGSGSKLAIVENKSGARAFMMALAKDNSGRFRAME